MPNFKGLCLAAVLVLAAFGPTLAIPRSAGVTTIPLILERNEGERRVIRGWPGHPKPGEMFILKVDPLNGGSSHLVLLTAELAPGAQIDEHRHPAADEILFLESGVARVRVGNVVRVAHGGSTVFIPTNTWISLSNIGHDRIRFLAVFSAPGFENFMRAVSVREGEKNRPMSQAENAAAEKKYRDVVVYKEP